MFRFKYTSLARQCLHGFRRFEQVMIIKAIEDQLAVEPEVEARNRKRLRPNRLSEFELRVAHCRVFYDVNLAEQSVTVKAVGEKERSRLLILGEEYTL